jgi:hypothetical protein
MATDADDAAGALEARIVSLVEDTSPDQTVFLIDDFPDEELQELKHWDKEAETYRYSYHPFYGARLRVLRQNWPHAQIESEKVDIQVHPDGDYVRAHYRATVRDPRTGRSGDGDGVADTRFGDGKMRNSIPELAQTRAKARALRDFGIGVDACSIEEMTRVGEGPEAEADSDGVDVQPRETGRESEGPIKQTARFQPSVGLSEGQERRLDRGPWKKRNGAWEATLNPVQVNEWHSILQELGEVTFGGEEL